LDDIGRSLRRVLRKPAVAAYLAEKQARLGAGHAITDVQGNHLWGDAAGAVGPSDKVELGGNVIAHVHGPARSELAQLVQVLATQDADTRALARESLDRYKELTMLYSLSEKIIGARDTSEIGAVACREAEQSLGCDSAAVLLFNAESGRLELVAAVGAPFLNRSTRETGGDIVSAVLHSGTGEIINRVEEDPRGLASSVKLSSIVCSPMKSNERVFGVLIAGSERHRHFNASDLQIVNAIAAQAAAAMEVTRLDRDLRATSRKPVDVIYGVNERPPIGVALMLGVQHMLIAVLTLAFPVLVTIEAGGTRLDAAAVVSMSLIAMAIGTVLQIARAGPVGSGFLAPSITSAIFLGPSMLAAKAGGLSLVFGMTMFAGVVALLLSQLLRRFRKLFPPEVSGVVVLMVGLSMVPVALSNFIGIGGEDRVAELRESVVGLLTLGTIMLVTVLRIGQIRLYATAIGLGVGYVAAAAMGLFEAATFESFADLPLVGLQSVRWHGITLDPFLMVPFVAAALASNVKDAGMLISYQKANDAGWKRPDTRSMSGGLVAGGLSNIVSGAIGGVGLGVSAGSVGLAIATGAMARSIGLVTAAIFVALAFLPEVTAMLALIPSPVLGAGLIYVACHLIASGAELIASRMLDSRRIYVVGLPLVAGVGLIAVPGLLDAAPSWAGAVLASPLAAATILALGLNLALNVGVSSRAVVSVGFDEGLKDVVARFFDQQGASWGARIDVISRAAPAVTEWCEELRAGAGAGAAAIDLLYDEFKLLATVRPAPISEPAKGESRKARTESFELAARTIARRYGCTAKLLPEQGIVFAFEH